MYPDLLICKNLEAPFRSALAELGEIAGCAAEQEDRSVGLRGLAVLAVAAVETAFLDALGYYHVARPESINLDRVTFNRSDVLDARAPLDLILVYSARRLKRLAFKSFPSIVETFGKRTRLGKISETCSQQLQDFQIFKNIRNRIVHGQRDLTTALLERPVSGHRIHQGCSLERGALLKNVKSAQVLLNRTLTQVEAKYSSHTRLAALERLWYWMFDSPVMEFEKFWAVDANKDEIVAFIRAEDEVHLSGSESILLSVWRAHFNNTLGPSPLTMYSLDSDSQRKLLHFLALAGQFRVY